MLQRASSSHKSRKGPLGAVILESEGDKPPHEQVVKVSLLKNSCKKTGPAYSGPPDHSDNPRHSRNEHPLEKPGSCNVGFATTTACTFRSNNPRFQAMHRTRLSLLRVFRFGDLCKHCVQCPRVPIVSGLQFRIGSWEFRMRKQFSFGALLCQFRGAGWAQIPNYPPLPRNSAPKAGLEYLENPETHTFLPRTGVATTGFSMIRLVGVARLIPCSNKMLAHQSRRSSMSWPVRRDSSTCIQHSCAHIHL